MVTLTGNSLTFGQLRLIGSGETEVAASDEGMSRVLSACEVLEGAISLGISVYGVNTGVGAMKDIRWSADDAATFHLGLVRAHHFGTGAYFPQATIRKAIAIRVNTLLRGRTGCSPGLVDAFLKLLRVNAVPAVRRTGSVGCADIGLMGQIGTVLIGGGEVFFSGRREATRDAFLRIGITPLKLGPRDGLASLAVNCVGLAAGAVALRRAARVIRLLMVTGLGASCLAGTSRDPWRSAIGVGGSDEVAIATWLWTNSNSLPWQEATRLQDPLSMRMLPQIFGAAIGQLRHAGEVVLQSTSRIDDNPVILDDEVLTSGGSLPLDVSIALQSCQLVLAHIARNVFNRCSILMNGGRRGLSVNLVSPGSISTGMGPAFKLVGDLCIRILALSHPLSAQQLTVSNGIEDEASYLPLIIERMEGQIDALLHMAALEALFVAQGTDLLNEEPCGMTAAVYGLVRGHSEHYSVDRPLSEDIESLKEAFEHEEPSDHLLRQSPLAEFDRYFDLCGPLMGDAAPRRARLEVG